MLRCVLMRRVPEHLFNRPTAELKVPSHVRTEITAQEVPIRVICLSPLEHLEACTSPRMHERYFRILRDWAEKGSVQFELK